MSDLSEAIEEAAAKAEADGYEVVRGNPRMLLVDFDAHINERELHRRMRHCQCLIDKNVVAIERVEKWNSKSGAWHVVLHLAEAIAGGGAPGAAGRAWVGSGARDPRSGPPAPRHRGTLGAVQAQKRGKENRR